MQVLTLGCLVVLGMILQSDLPPGDHEFFTNALVWLFIAFLFSLLK
ncbi:hypothetical protein F6453_1427 [Marinobacter nauticus]|uniref:Uncharacterized protein n=1 Tax=Marinobacter nauticus TaxID=2743 RepID=A0A833JRC1_MARNT|nr:hypothetical protein F6453_1427 [Marinobacter nauticus]